MTPAEQFITDLNGVYNGIPVLATVNVFDKFWGDVFGAQEDEVIIRPLNRVDKIGEIAGQSITLKFPKK